MSSRRKVFLALIAAAVVVFVALQLVPVPARTNPPVTNPVVWNSPETEALVRRTCYDCHSNETVWPWYAYIAPMSWLVARDVEEGRAALNMSTSTGELEAFDLVARIRNGEMPLPIYKLFHPAANLTPDEQAQLIDGINASLPGG